MARKQRQIETFGLRAGRKIGPHYQVVQLLGSGSEGEVYQIQEFQTGIPRAAKLFFPDRRGVNGVNSVNGANGAAVWYARKLHKLRQCPIVLQYHHTQPIQIAKQKVLCLISDFCEGVPLDRWIAAQRAGRLHPYIALHVLYHLARGLEAVHSVGEYHSDVHSENILIQPRGVGFETKLIDFFNWGRPARYKQEQDVLDVIRVFHECLGGHDSYWRLSKELRHICAGLQKTLIARRFPTMIALRLHLESFDWTTL